MALMIPAEINEFETEGEKTFYSFLSVAAKPDDYFLAWYTPDLQGKEPDFILYSKIVGLIVFEVKDWLLEQIREANPHQFSLEINGKVQLRKNPLRQARNYIGSLKDKIRADGKLVSPDPTHHGNPRIPINFGVVFPNIKKYDYKKTKLHSIIPIEKVFFWDDMHPESDLCRDPSGKYFQKELSDRFPPVFKFRASPRDVQHLKQLLFPEVRIELPNRAGQGSYVEQTERLKVLDNHQESISRQFDSGHRIIIGPSGSGKTLILAHKALFLQRYNPAIKSILFVCYNITLVNYVKRILAGKGVPLGEERVTVCHFFELCAKILDQNVSFENEEPAYYEMVTQETLSKVASHGKRFDAVLVDEGQDFTCDMFKVVTRLLNPATNNLTIALDENQNIYSPKRKWSELGINARGRTYMLQNVYRNSIEISSFASRFLGNNSENEEKAVSQLRLFEYLYDFQGAEPELCQYDNLDRMVTGVSEKSASLIKSEGYPLFDIAVLFAMKKPEKSRSDNLPEMIEAALEKHGIPSQWMSESYQTKKAYDINTNRVTISTIHSSKGLDYAVVFLLGLDYLTPKEWTDEQIVSLAYVGITRARYRLIICNVNQTPLIKKIQRALKGNS
jgi:hypothetical protein